VTQTVGVERSSCQADYEQPDASEYFAGSDQVHAHPDDYKAQQQRYGAEWGFSDQIEEVAHSLTLARRRPVSLPSPFPQALRLRQAAFPLPRLGGTARTAL
jgi:hypothetical protein